MSDNYKDQDIEKLIFGGALASGSIEPSEGFWNKAYEHILQRESSLNQKRVLRWRTGFYVMTAVAMLMVWYGVYMRNEVNDIKLQVTSLASSSAITSQNITHKEVTGTTENSSSTTGKTETTFIQKDQMPKAFSEHPSTLLTHNKKPKTANRQENSINNSSSTNSGRKVLTGNSEILLSNGNVNDTNHSITDDGSHKPLNTNLLQTISPSTQTTSIQDNKTSIINM